MRIVAAGLRSLAAVASIAAVVATFVDTASRTTINPVNFFGFFTLQSNILGAVVFGVAAAVGFSGRAIPAWLSVALACSTTYLLVVGIVYNTLLVGLPGGVELAWANTVLHVLVPLYALVDWLAFGDWRLASWGSLPIVLAYPLVWCAVVLVRGATDGWVPYPFLDPSTGYGSVLLYVLGIAVAIAAIAVLVWWRKRGEVDARTAA